MKKVILFAFLAIFSLCAFAITPDSKSKSENAVSPDKKENKMSEEEVNSLTKRVEATGNLNNKQTVVVQEDHRNGRGHHRENRRNGGVIFLGGGGVLLLVILIILLA